MRKQALVALFLASLMLGGSLNAAVTVSGEGALGFVSEGKNAPLGGAVDSSSGFVFGTAGIPSLFNNSLYVTGELAKDTTFYSEFQLAGAASTFAVNELNVTWSGLKMGRFTVPFGYYIPSSAYSSWNKLQRQDQLGFVISSGGVLPGFETGLMYSGTAGALGYNVYTVQGGGLFSYVASTAAVKDALNFGGQLTYNLNKDAQVGFAMYMNSDDQSSAHTSTAWDLFGKYGMGALTLSGEYINISIPAGYVNGTAQFGGLLPAATIGTATTSSGMYLEADFSVSKQLSLAARYTSFDPDTAVANNGRSAIQAGAEFAANDFLTYGAEYTVRNNEGTDTADDSSITLTSQFKF